MAKTAEDRAIAKAQRDVQAWQERLTAHATKVEGAEVALADLERARNSLFMQVEILGDEGARMTLGENTAAWQAARLGVDDLRRVAALLKAELGKAEAALEAARKAKGQAEFDALCRERYALGRQVEVHVEALVPILQRLRENGSQAQNAAFAAGFRVPASAWHSTLVGYLLWRLHGVFGFDFSNPIPTHRGLFTEIDAFARRGAPAETAAPAEVAAVATRAE